MASFVFACLILASLGLAIFAKRGHHTESVREFFIASRQFGGFLVFFLAVGEIYSIGTIIGFPGGIYAMGGTYGIWFLGYILLAYPVGYFVNPWIWRAGKVYDAVTLPDLFKGHFRDHRYGRFLELSVTIAAIVFLVPWGQLQFSGLIIALNGLGWHFNPIVLTVLAAALAFTYVAVSGIRAPAYVAILKDILMVLAIVVTGVAAVSAVGLGSIFHIAGSVAHNHLNAPQLRFTMSTITFQALGFFMFPFNMQNLFTARSEQTIRRTQMFMPLYMLMYPFLVVTSYYALSQHTHLAAPNQAFMAVAVSLLPGWVLGMVAAGASLSGLIVLAGISLAIGPLVSRNLFGHVPETRQRSAARLVIVLYLAASILLTLMAPNLLLTIINTAFFGITQFFPGVLAIIFFRRAHPLAIGAGIIVADVLSIAFYLAGATMDGLNIGFVCLLINIVILVGGSLLMARDPRVVPVAARESGLIAAPASGD
ncbi:MAG: sodium:solute symporter [Acidiphilium sp. 37-64-53]|uniref:sodium:solute symporter family protein n=1 Tax=Acidiphilium TaxID=522 RepID=UPI000BDB5E9C|nr:MULTISPECIES: sodium:solute symporter family protein [Acidiphilium]OYW00413.1 MAG: sodium:solute symporter [Acidiphilium sp. 37-64-53]OZB25444.1 MAG: sodium:solute symporter [Acidiphilium sp. 34-64-41]HQT86520.1 sodium:solute symporter family protein [Acidiphilium rubrum]